MMYISIVSMKPVIHKTFNRAVARIGRSSGIIYTVTQNAIVKSGVKPDWNKLCTEQTKSLEVNL